MKNLHKRPMAFNGALTKRKEHKNNAPSNAMGHFSLAFRPIIWHYEIIRGVGCFYLSKKIK